jgi:hypothetical protein
MAEGQGKEPSLVYLCYMVVGALAIVATLIIAGLRGWSLLPTLLIGAGVQMFFRTVKRLWRNAFGQSHGTESTAWTRRDYQWMALSYIVMVGVCALWYGVGWLLR